MIVYYAREQSVARNQSYSPSAGKPELLVTQWLERWPERIELLRPEPASPADFHLAHAPEMVDDILGCRRPNGFSNRSPEVAQSLPWTTGSMVSAALHAAHHRNLVCSPTSGFHHAGYEHCGAYCTFNGLIVAARRVGGTVAILDCDNHYGDGTDEIIRRLDLATVRHYTTGKHADVSRPEAFLEALPENDVEGEELHFVWDVEGRDGKTYLLLRLGEALLWTERVFYEDWERFNEVREMLKKRYPGRFQSLQPTPGSELWLYGDDIRAPGKISFT